MYVGMSVCMYVCMSVCLYVCMSVCLYVCMSVCLYVCMSVCLYVCMSVCMYACMHACMHACTYASVSVGVHVHTCTSVCACTFAWMSVCLYVRWSCMSVCQLLALVQASRQVKHEGVTGKYVRLPAFLRTCLKRRYVHRALLKSCVATVLPVWTSCLGRGKLHSALSAVAPSSSSSAPRR